MKITEDYMKRVRATKLSNGSTLGECIDVLGNGINFRSMVAKEIKNQWKTKRPSGPEIVGGLLAKDFEKILLDFEQATAFMPENHLEGVTKLL